MGESDIKMSSQNDAVPAHLTAAGPDVEDTKSKQIKENLQKYEQLFGADEDAFEQPTTTRKELWSYYLYYNVSSNVPRASGYRLTNHRETMELVLDPILKHCSNLH
jgi:hypothetical protein